MKTAKQIGISFKTLVLALAMVLACVFVLSACGKSNPSNKPGDPASISEQTVVDQITSLNNSTTDVTLSYSMTKSTSPITSYSVSDELSGITVKMNDSKFAITAPETNIYGDGLNLYVQTMDDDANYWDYAGVLGLDSMFGEISALLPTNQEFAGYYQQIVAQLGADN